MVLKVNILSPNKHQVRTGKTKKPVPEPMNLDVHTESVAVAIILQAYQKTMLVGTPKTNAQMIGLSAHLFQIN